MLFAGLTESALRFHSFTMRAPILYSTADLRNIMHERVKQRMDIGTPR